MIDREDTVVNIIAYILIDNHFHLLLQEKEENGISRFMSRLLTAYSMYINSKYSRTGPLMCRPFRSQHIDSEEYLLWCINYIHSNLAKHYNNRSSTTSQINYPFSSYKDYIYEDRAESVILDALDRDKLQCDTDQLNELDFSIHD